MIKYSLVFNEREYILGEDNCDYFINDEEEPISGIERNSLLSLLNEAKDVDFSVEYYDQPCSNCHAGIKDKQKYFKFLEYHFYIYTLNNQYVISSISKEYENTSFKSMLKQGKVDNSYIASIMVCEFCGNYSIEIEQCEV